MRNQAQTELLTEQTADPMGRVVHWPLNYRKESVEPPYRVNRLGRQQHSMAFAALAGSSSTEVESPMTDEWDHEREKSGDPMMVTGPPVHSLARLIGCPYCRGLTYNLSHQFFGSGILARGECSSRGTRGRTIFESTRFLSGAASRRAQSSPV